MTQQIASPVQSPSALPPAESSQRSGGRIEISPRAERPTNAPAFCPRLRRIAAPQSATRGTYGLAKPTISGAKRAPMSAPAISPASDNAPVRSPRRKPLTAASAITATAIQSARFTLSVCPHLRPAPPFPPVRRYNRAALGGVVQLVRTPACHAGGRGFESRRSRPLYKPFPPDDEDPDSLRALDLSGFISARDVDHPRWSFLTIGTVFAVVTWLGVGCLRRVHEQVRLLRQRGAPSRS